jgi:hypothetical protein
VARYCDPLALRRHSHSGGVASIAGDLYSTDATLLDRRLTVFSSVCLAAPVEGSAGRAAALRLLNQPMLDALHRLRRRRAGRRLAPSTLEHLRVVEDMQQATIN